MHVSASGEIEIFTSSVHISLGLFWHLANAPATCRAAVPA